MINDAIAKSYEASNYASHAYEQSFIANLHARSRLRDLNPKAPNSAKVLEIGCASGGNFIAQALVFKDAHFTGIDLSKAQIKNGKTALEKIGIKNIDLFCLDICDTQTHFGSHTPAHFGSQILLISSLAAFMPYTKTTARLFL
nr:class I SAM-dependent methyltransferase [uncultured Campylobacter sp.]